MACEENGISQVYSFRRSTHPDSIYNWIDIYPFDGDTPSLSGDQDELHVVYSREGDLYAKQWLWNHDSDGWYYTTNLTNDAPGFNHRNPSLALSPQGATVYGTSFR